MSTLKTLGLAIGIVFAASSFAFAQQGSPATNQQGNPATSQPSNPASNAAASGGTHQTSQNTGSAANAQKLAHNQTGHRGHYRGRRLYSYYRSGPCHLVYHPVTGRLVRVCR